VLAVLNRSTTLFCSSVKCRYFCNVEANLTSCKVRVVHIIVAYAIKSPRACCGEMLCSAGEISVAVPHNTASTTYSNTHYLCFICMHVNDKQAFTTYMQRYVLLEESTSGSATTTATHSVAATATSNRRSTILQGKPKVTAKQAQCSSSTAAADEPELHRIFQQLDADGR
jgi:hypothetical protein